MSVPETLSNPLVFRRTSPVHQRALPANISVSLSALIFSARAFRPPVNIREISLFPHGNRPQTAQRYIDFSNHRRHFLRRRAALPGGGRFARQDA